MEKIIEEYLRNNTLEQVTKDWNEQQELSDMSKYTGWIEYIIHNRKEPICKAIWGFGLISVFEDEKFRLKVQSGDADAFKELKNKVVDVLVTDNELMHKLYKTGKIKDKRELFIKERSKWYL